MRLIKQNKDRLGADHLHLIGNNISSSNRPSAGSVDTFSGAIKNKKSGSDGKLSLQRDKSNKSDDEVKHIDLIHRMFPNGIENTTFKQGRRGDCSLLSAIRSTCTHQPEKIADIIKPGKKAGTVLVEYKGLKPVVLKEADSHNGGVSGDPGIKVMELAWAIATKPGFWRRNKTRLNGIAPSKALKALTGSSDVASVGSHGVAYKISKPKKSIVSSALQATKTQWPSLWNDDIDRACKKDALIYEDKPISDDKKEDVFKELNAISKEPKKYVAVADTRQFGEMGTKVKLNRYMLPKIKMSLKKTDESHSLFKIKNNVYRQHAYSIIKANAGDRTVTLSNPHGRKPNFTLSYEQFSEDFARVNVANVT